MADINELAQRLEKLEDMFTQHLQEGATRNAHIQALTSGVERLNHTVYGNGKEGLTTTTARIDERLIAVTESVNELPEQIREQIDLALNAALPKVKPEEKKEEKKSPADKAVAWLLDRVLPYFVTGLFIILLQALWELVKVKLATP
jgi:hypothetical protein